VRAVVFGVVTAGLHVVMFGVAGVTMSTVRMVRCLLVIARVMMLGGFTMMLGGQFVMFGGLLMMLYARMVAHNSLPIRFHVNGMMSSQAI
jgi:hypothetical protein